MLKRMLLVAGLMVALASPALAETNGVYVGLKFLDSIQSTGSVSKSSGISQCLRCGQLYPEHRGRRHLCGL